MGSPYVRCGVAQLPCSKPTGRADSLSCVTSQIRGTQAPGQAVRHTAAAAAAAAAATLRPIHCAWLVVPPSSGYRYARKEAHLRIKQRKRRELEQRRTRQRRKQLMTQMVGVPCSACTAPNSRKTLTMY